MGVAGLGAACLTSCAGIGVQHSITSDGFLKKHGSAEYCALKSVRQHSESACGLACVESLLSYWDLPGTQAELAAANPLGSTREGYSFAELKSIAEARGLQAFAVSFDADPMALLHRQMESGRPVLLAIRCPRGRYFGDPLPVIEHLDSSVVGVSVREERLADAPVLTTRGRTKDHYVVAFGFDKPAEQILLMDPAYGLVSLAESRLLSFWGEQNHAALVCAR